MKGYERFSFVTGEKQETKKATREVFRFDADDEESSPHPRMFDATHFEDLGCLVTLKGLPLQVPIQKIGGCAEDLQPRPVQEKIVDLIG